MSNNRHRGPMGPGPAVAEKPKDFKKALGKLYGFIKPFIVPIIVALLFAVAGTVLNLIGPNKLGDLTNLIQASFDFDENSLQWILSDVNLQEVTSVCIFLVVIYSVGLLCSYLQGVIMATVTQKNSQGLRRAISKKINLLPLKYFDSNSVGDVLSRVTNDVDTIGQTLNQSLVTRCPTYG